MPGSTKPGAEGRGMGGRLVLAVGRAMCGGLKWQPTIEPQKGN